MIIFGTRGVTTTCEKGTFYCPSCEEQQAFAHRRVRRFFHLYWIPIIPLDSAGEYIECGQCRGTFRLEVLRLVPRPGRKHFEAEFERAMKRAMVHMMMADGEIGDGEVERVGAIYHRVAGTALSEEDLFTTIDEARHDSDAMLSDLKRIGRGLNDKGKETVRSALMIAAADGVFHDDEEQLLHRIADAVEMTPAHYRGVLTQAEVATPT